MLWGKVCVQVLCGLMVDVVELWESGCFEAKCVESVLSYFAVGWLSSGRVDVKLKGKVCVELL